MSTTKPADTWRSGDPYERYVGRWRPAPTYAMALDEGKRARLREHIRSRIRFDADGAASLQPRAWAVRGTVAP